MATTYYVNRYEPTARSAASLGIETIGFDLIENRDGEVEIIASMDTPDLAKAVEWFQFKLGGPVLSVKKLDETPPDGYTAVWQVFQ